MHVKYCFRLWIGFFLCLTALVSGGCTSAQQTRKPPRMLKLGAPVRDFVAKDRDGEYVWLGKYVKTGEEEPENPKDVLLVFFATWCKPCCGELPMIAEYQRNHKDVQVIVVALPSENLESFLDDLLRGDRDLFPVVVDKDMKIINKFFGVGGVPLPFSYFIDKSGVVAIRMWGFRKGKNVDMQLFEARQK